jgi:cobalt-zinc-cadmium efflux system protein
MFQVLERLLVSGRLPISKNDRFTPHRYRRRATVSITARSLAVFAEGGDYLLDAAGVGVALIAFRLSTRASSGATHHCGRNAATIAALTNAGWLLVLEAIVAGAAIDRLIHRTPRVDGLPVLIVSAIAAVVMAVGALVLRSDGKGTEPGARDLSVAAVLLDTIADATAAAGVAVAGAIILGTDGWYWLARSCGGIGRSGRLWLPRVPTQ